MKGENGRASALDDSAKVSKLFILNKLKTIVIDTSQRESETAKDLAQNLQGNIYFFHELMLISYQMLF